MLFKIFSTEPGVKNTFGRVEINELMGAPFGDCFQIIIKKFTQVLALLQVVFLSIIGVEESSVICVHHQLAYTANWKIVNKRKPKQ